MKIDLSKIKTKDFVKWLGSDKFPDLYLILKQGTNGEIEKSFLIEIPQLMSSFTYELTQWDTDIQLAVTSMRKYLLEDTSDN